ncbi:MAG TPA: hypothetical protein PL182_12915 [Pseudobdellovibrionaceae bacterium]|nr:hypothetical protein [Pseudobdellovibrionaceae bacterium]
MKQIVFVLLGFAFALPLQAQERVLKNDILNLLEDIRSEVDFSRASRRDLENIRAQLRDIRETLRYGSGGGTQPGPRPPLSCISRDNDGMNPFVVSLRDPSDFSETKIPGTVGSKENCERAISQAREVEGVLFICGSRDNDGQNPYGLVMFSLRTKAAKTFASFRDLNECATMLSQALVSRTHLSVCASRDNDGLRPYTRLSIEIRSGDLRSSGATYDSLNSCVSGR